MTDEKDVPGQDIKKAACERFSIFLVLQVFCVVIGCGSLPIFWGQAVLAVIVYALLMFIGSCMVEYKWHEAFDRLADHWRVREADANLLRATCHASLDRESETEEFIRIFHPSQGQIDEVLKAAALRVEAACEDVRRLYVAGANGFSGVNYPSTDLWAEVPRLKKAFEAEQDRRGTALAEAVTRFGRLWDLAKHRGYEVKKCWPDYVGMASSEPEQAPQQ